jgi:hypothetical protein
MLDHPSLPIKDKTFHRGAEVAPNRCPTLERDALAIFMDRF